MERSERRCTMGPRAGLQAMVVQNRIVLFVGFGLSTDPTNPSKRSNPMDVWVSKNGQEWSQVSNSLWNAGGIESSTAHQASFSTQGEKEACHGEAPSEAGHPPPRRYRVSN